LDELIRRNVKSHQWVVYAQRKDPVGSARRLTNHLSDLIRNKAQGKFDPAWIEAIIYIESGGQNLEPKTYSGAAGIAQFMPATARAYGLKVNLERRAYLTRRLVEHQRELNRLKHLSPFYTKKIIRRVGRKRFTRSIRIDRSRSINNQLAQHRQMVARVENELPSTDQRMIPELSLEAMVKYLTSAQKMYGRTDLAIQSYHSGSGNMGKIINAYISPKKPRNTVRETVEFYRLSWPKIYFDCRPRSRNPRTHTVIFGMADYSYTYFWNVKAAKDALDLYRQNPKSFRQWVGRYSSIRRKNSLKGEVLA
jgi:hypothetical protein